MLKQNSMRVVVQPPRPAAELPEREPQEADGQPLAPPPIPFASKPRFELDGGYRGNEVGSP